MMIDGVVLGFVLFFLFGGGFFFWFVVVLFGFSFGFYYH